MGTDCYGKACTRGHAHIDEQKGPEVELGGQAQHAVDELGAPIESATADAGV